MFCRRFLPSVELKLQKWCMHKTAQRFFFFFISLYSLRQPSCSISLYSSRESSRHTWPRAPELHVPQCHATQTCHSTPAAQPFYLQPAHGAHSFFTSICLNKASLLCQARHRDRVSGQELTLQVFVFYSSRMAHATRHMQLCSR